MTQISQESGAANQRCYDGIRDVSVWASIGAFAESLIVRPLPHSKKSVRYAKASQDTEPASYHYRNLIVADIADRARMEDALRPKLQAPTLILAPRILI